MSASKQTSPVRPSRSGSAIWIAVVVAVVVAGVIALVVARSSNDDKKAKVDVTEQSGETIPTVSGKTLDGEDITIEADGKAKLILFVAHWCPHCQAEVPRIVEHVKEKPLPDDVELVTVSTSVNPAAANYPPKAWLERENWPFPVMADTADGAAAKAYGLTAFPYFVVADADGKIVTTTSGEITMDQFDQLVEAAQTGKAP